MSALGDPWQVLAACPHCRVEAAVVQVMDPAHPASHLGRPSEARCRLCTWQTIARAEPFHPKLPPTAGRCPNCQAPLSEAARTGQGICAKCGYTPRIREASPPLDLKDPEVAREALTAWARAEGEGDTDQFCRANLGLALDTVVLRLGRGEAIESNFDVIAWLFPDSGGSTLLTPADAPSARPVEVVDRAPPPAANPDPEPQRELDPRVPARVLISVMAADGELRPGERRFIDAYLAHEGLPALDPADLRIWRPHELDVPPTMAARRALIEACVHLVHLDRERDGTEWKVVRAFAGAWGVPDEDLNAWDAAYDAQYSTTMTRLWRRLSGFVRLR